MSFVGFDPHVPEGVGHIGVTHQYPLYWEFLSQCHEFVKEIGQRVCAQTFRNNSVRVSISVELTFLASVLLIKRSIIYDPDLVGDYGRQRGHS